MCVGVRVHVCVYEFMRVCGWVWAHTSAGMCEHHCRSKLHGGSKPHFNPHTMENMGQFVDDE